MSSLAVRCMTSLRRNRDVIVSHDVMSLSALTLLTVLCVGVTSALPGRSISEAVVIVITNYLSTDTGRAISKVSSYCLPAEKDQANNSPKTRCTR